MQAGGRTGQEDKDGAQRVALHAPQLALAAHMLQERLRRHVGRQVQGAPA